MNFQDPSIQIIQIMENQIGRSNGKLNGNWRYRVVYLYFLFHADAIAAVLKIREDHIPLFQV